VETNTESYSAANGNRKANQSAVAIIVAEVAIRSATYCTVILKDISWPEITCWIFFKLARVAVTNHTLAETVGSYHMKRESLGDANHGTFNCTIRLAKGVVALHELLYCVED